MAWPGTAAATGFGKANADNDLDAADERIASGVGAPVPGGLTYREAHLATEVAHDSGRLLAMDLMEVNPIEDVRNPTALLGAELVCSAYGKTIL